ncbi:TPA: MltR family transcriptional regulator [Aeromonas salmonicida]|uniref:MltR family transcriptional regulator n=1 Tax=Aeromonas salmonicida TaxID=645 RepID=UPI00044A102E|nr:MltR family transcriptional regulator [Aeromonas salmonicida]ELI6406750.1 MltR family transcriptional regulator [Aeromonas salmonicida subsp. salmonicida]ASI24696.1 mannitol operon repressor [Aeromonas salmonicida]ASI29015.1 mannitol operon repressor [Aeromonas salmonicida]ASI33145.1 mannitol operon repressor [Aeromonas salmonicida]ATD36713.1 transcriptional regulator [Aeromonas salmonicida subsp. masoucida]
MTTHQEDEVLERLNEQDGPRGFFLEVVTILEEAVDSLMRRAFRQEEYAVKYAIEPLLNQSGPLGQLEVRLKLIFALGLISLERYQDLEAYLKIRDFLVRDPKDYRFSDKPIRDLLDRLHCLNQGSMMPQDPPEDWPFYQMQLNRLDQVVRSALVLAVADCVTDLHKESPI